MSDLLSNDQCAYCGYTNGTHNDVCIAAENERLRSGIAEHRKWLADRVEWLKYEMDHGGDWKYLQLRREETMYCLEKFNAHSPALKETQP